MDVWRLLAAVLRRWYVFLLIAMLAAGGAWLAGSRVPPEYTASSAVLLVPPVQPFPGNPYGDLGTAAQSLVIVLQTGPTRANVLAEAGGDATYVVSAIPRTPILRFTARASTPEAASATALALVNATSNELLRRQADASIGAPLQVKSQVLEAPTGTIESLSNRLQAQVLVFGIGLVLAFLIAVFVDDLVLLWRRRRDGNRLRRPIDRQSGPQDSASALGSVGRRPTNELYSATPNGLAGGPTVAPGGLGSVGAANNGYENGYEVESTRRPVRERG